jgi:hypothetical protein
VYDLYARGITNKFDILDLLDDESEDLLIRFNKQISPTCWTKAALLTIAEVIQELLVQEGRRVEDLEQNLINCISLANKAFEQFPWRLSELVEQAPELYETVLEAYPENEFADKISKRQLIKICKGIAYS